MVFSFIGGGNRRKPQTSRKSLTNLTHNVVSSTPRHERDSDSQRLLCKSNYHTITTTTAHDNTMSLIMDVYWQTVSFV